MPVLIRETHPVGHNLERHGAAMQAPRARVVEGAPGPARPSNKANKQTNAQHSCILVHMLVIYAPAACPNKSTFVYNVVVLLHLQHDCVVQVGLTALTCLTCGPQTRQRRLQKS